MVLVDESFAPDFINHDPMVAVGGAEGVKQLIASATGAFPDLHFTIEDMIAEGDRVTIRGTYQGTHQGDFMGIPATGKAATIPAIYILRMTQGKIAETWVVQDNLGMMQQLGVIPAPGQAPS